MPEHDTQPTAEEREAQLAAREAALAAREAELAEREAEAAQASAPRKGSLLNNGDPHFKNEKEKIYDHFPLSVHQTSKTRRKRSTTTSPSASTRWTS